VSLKKRIRRLQREFNRGGGVLTMPDGTEMPYGELELFDALIATIEGEEHWLLPYCREIHEAAEASGWYLEHVPDDDVAYARLLWAINAGAEAAKAEDEANKQGDAPRGDS